VSALGEHSTTTLRVNYAWRPETSFFLEGGYLDTDVDKDNKLPDRYGFLVGGGFIHVLPEIFALPLAVRGEFDYAISTVDLWRFNLMAVSHYELDFATVYFAAGLDYKKIKYEYTAPVGNLDGYDGWNLDPAAAAGMLYQFESFDSLSVFGELTFVGEFYGNAGIRYLF
jgi:hypothetical protein